MMLELTERATEMHDAALPARRSLRAPRANGSALVEPGFDQMGRLLDQNVQRRQRYEYDLGGRSIASLTEQAREEVCRAARDYVASYGGPAAEAVRGTERMVLAGHQPQMFHPGVWFKNFALDLSRGSAAQRPSTSSSTAIRSNRLRCACPPAMCPVRGSRSCRTTIRCRAWPTRCGPC